MEKIGSRAAKATGERDNCPGDVSNHSDMTTWIPGAGDRLHLKAL
jgi:hypothetical protein